MAITGLLDRPFFRRAIARVGRTLADPMRSGGRRREGLCAPISRHAFLASLAGKRILEIGPLDRPAVRGPHVRYFDVLDQAGLAHLAAAEGREPANCPVIDFVSPTGDLSGIDEEFDLVFSSHAVEHQPDLIAHLQGVARLLRPGGEYRLAIPDRRYTFDHFQPPSTLADVVAAHRQEQRVHTAGSVLNARLNTTHNDALRHWLGQHGAPGFYGVTRSDAERDAARAAAGEYIDVHAWMWTPASFTAITTGLFRDGYITLEPSSVHDTGFGELEFFATLTKSL